LHSTAPSWFRPQIMYNNGVSHLTSIHDYDGVLQVLNWMSYVPIARGQPCPVMRASIRSDSTMAFAQDPIDRVIGFVPTRAAYDPRWMLAGRTHSDKEHQSGFFDRGSFVEVMGGWARTVVTGRARLGGIPVGIIAVETNPVTVHVAADPANAASVATVTQQAGQVQTAIDDGRGVALTARARLLLRPAAEACCWLARASH